MEDGKSIARGCRTATTMGSVSNLTSR